MRIGRLATLAAALALAQPAIAGTIRTLFVGIDTYKNSAASEGRIANLAGPRNDVSLIKAVLRDTKHLALDPLDPAVPGGSCRGESALSITLVDGCAAHDAVVAALDGEIARSAAGDMVLFYFAGHGTTYEDEAFDQSNGENDSIEPYDSGDAHSAPQILDAELRVKIDHALARGVSVVTIFDSCHSGTATRGLTAAHARRILPGPTAQLPPDRLRALRTPVVAPPQLQGVRAYRVHLAAAADDQLAQEYPYGAVIHGAFTYALADAIRATPDATYGDLLRAANKTIRVPPDASQTPQVEGALAATFLGADPGDVRLYDAAPAESGLVKIEGGSLSGITAGSRFAVFADMTRAVAPRAQPLATGVVATVSAEAATLRLDGGAPAALAASLEVREIDHRFLPDAVRVALRFARGDDPAAAREALAKLDMVRLVDRYADLTVVATGGAAVLQDAHGREVAALGRIADPLFAEQVRGAVRIVARYGEMLALGTVAAPLPALAGQPCDGMPDSGVCVTRNCTDLPDGAVCAPLRRRANMPVFAPGDRFLITIRNITDRPRYLYLFDLEPDHFSVTPFTPPGSKDIFLPGKSVQFTGTAGVAGRAQLLLLATDRWINLAALAQDGLARDTDPLARLLQAAESGTRAVDPPAVPTWSGTLASLCVIDPKGSAEGDGPCGDARSH